MGHAFISFISQSFHSHFLVGSSAALELTITTHGEIKGLSQIESTPDSMSSNSSVLVDEI
jgi:hypothetical protein